MVNRQNRVLRIKLTYFDFAGGANEAVIRMLISIGSPDNVPAFVEAVKRREKVLSGFGHRWALFTCLTPFQRSLQARVQCVQDCEWHPRRGYNDELINIALSSRILARLSFGKRQTKSSKCEFGQNILNFARLKIQNVHRTGKDELLETAMRLHDVAMNDEYFIKRKLAPNVDFWWAFPLCAILMTSSHQSRCFIGGTQLDMVSIYFC